MKSITGSLAFATIMSLFLVGCASSPPSTNPTEAALEKPPKVVQPESATISKEDFEKIPKNLRPEDLEQRHDTTVVIRSGDNETIREYRINGFLYGIQVIPKVGEPYYLIAADHMGNFIDPTKPEMLIPSWTIFRWK
ncbi:MULTISPECIES: DUF2782 domain-containing protein [unclassified Endozoicomonas]|uniref:DUF2782 domain-containing protein n=2 Tax=Endozoicomonas TaxID=305899 RepID=UPI00214983EF|nr:MULTISPECIES: DUF2782 domain-containing protein [unclassified Endozoicomonas]